MNPKYMGIALVGLAQCLFTYSMEPFIYPVERHLIMSKGLLLELKRKERSFDTLTDTVEKQAHSSMKDEIKAPQSGEHRSYDSRLNTLKSKKIAKKVHWDPEVLARVVQHEESLKTSKKTIIQPPPPAPRVSNYFPTIQKPAIEINEALRNAALLESLSSPLLGEKTIRADRPRESNYFPSVKNITLPRIIPKPDA